VTTEVLALFGGIQVVLTGLVAYLGKIWLTRLHEKLKNNLEKSLYVFRAGFDVEFKLYQDLWAKVAAVRRAIRSGLAVGASAEPFETDQFSRDVERSIEEVRNLAEMQRPFFAAGVAERLNLVTELVTHWSASWARTESSSRAAWLMGEGFSHLHKLNKAIDALCEAIRSRITGPYPMT
jgi:hypothetical protein